ncbi:uracil-DNA glycosylase family protein [Polaromonas sp.]|uniref:uracil-DNA glycosylase family protein n=1 Tax=Polaromonas sp. TaxID=1869339 RepID=UPI00286C48A8|nr:uracil-DNA glycosylase family protein [Polaromonas sp.]
MSLNLDKRQRAMLREMGVQIWQPAAPATPAAQAAPEAELPEPQRAINSIAATSRFPGTTAPIAPQNPPARRPPPSAPVAAPAPPPQAPADSGAASWRLGEACALYADAGAAPGARWLVLAETPAAALRAQPFEPLQGEAGKLLDNMLRAARKHQAGSVLLVPLARLAASSGLESELPAALAALLASARPDLVLVMGRLAAQALLQSTEPLGRLRGQVHRLQGAATVVSYDAHYLLRNPADKARAWDDLCLAMSLAPSLTAAG